MTTSTTNNAIAGAVPDAAARNKGIAMGAVGTLVAAAVIGGAAWFAFTRGDAIEQTNRMGTPTTVIGEAAPGAALQSAQPLQPVPAGQPAQPNLPPPVYQPSPPVAQTALPATVPHTVPAQRPVQPVAQGRAGVIASVHEVTLKGDSNGVGAVAGGVLGGLLGHQVGGGNGRTALTIAGAVGGGFAGNEVQKRMNGTKAYNVVVQFDDGSTETLRENSARGWHSGDRVRVKNGVILSDNA